MQYLTNEHGLSAIRQFTDWAVQARIVYGPKRSEVNIALNLYWPVYRNSRYRVVLPWSVCSGLS